MLACLVGMSGCSPGRIGADGSGTSSESGLALDSESEDGPIVETDSESDDGEDTDWGGPGPCDREGSLKWLDVCEPRDPCDSTVCEGELECLGGQCVAPKPTQPCQGIELVEYELPIDLTSDSGPLLFSNIDGMLGDELIAAGHGEVEVLRAGELLVSAILPDGFVNVLHPMQLGGDEHIDLLVFSERYQDDFAAFSSGDGEGHFEPALAQLPVGLGARSPFPIDFDNDGDHDVVAPTGATTQVYRNDADALAWLTELAIDGRLGVATDLDLDGFVDDMLFGDYPSPTALIGDGGQLIEAGSLPEPSRGPNLQYGVGRPLTADLDGDGFVEVLSLLSDGNGRVGGRIWWGLPGNTFAEPRDQLLASVGWPHDAGSFVGFVELDGAPPHELLHYTEDRLGVARADPTNQLPFECFSLLLEFGQTLREAPVVGDLDADGQPEIAIRDGQDVRVYTVVAVP